MKKNIYSFFKYQIFILMLLVIPFINCFANTIIAKPRENIGFIENGELINYDYNYIDLYGNQKTGTTHYFHLKTTNDESLYCIQPGVDFPTTEGVIYTLNTTSMTAPVCALIGYAEGKQGMVDWSKLSDADYREVQEIIWKNLNSTATCGSGFITLSTKTNPEVKIMFEIADSTSFILNNGVYYSNTIYINVADLIKDSYYDVSVSGVDGAYIVETIGGEAITSTKKSEFLVAIPQNNVKGSINITLSVTGKYAKETITKYRPRIDRYISTGYQDVALIKNEEVKENTEAEVSASTELKLTTSTLTIIKKDVETEKTIEGVSFTLLDRDGKVAKKADGTEVGILKTNNEGKIIIDNLLYGDYNLKEMGVPDGYILNSEELPIVIDAGAEEVIVTNVPVDITKISKVDSVTGKALVGAELKVLDSSGVELFKFTSTEEVFEVYLSPGIHYIEEVTAPEGYDKLNVVYEFEVTEQGDIVALSESDYFELKNGIIYVYNTPTPEEVVEVPDTGGNMNLYLIIGGGMLLGGISVIAVILNKRKKAVNQI